MAENMLARPRVFSPRQLNDGRGMSREPVGGGTGIGDFSQLTTINTVAPAQITTPLQEKGLTYPITVTSVSSEIAPIDLTRKFLFIQNNDTVGKVTIAFGGSGATLGIGFQLAPGGGALLLDNHVPTARIFAIGTIASNPNLTMVTA